MLPAKYQKLVRLRYFQELSYEEIAEELDDTDLLVRVALAFPVGEGLFGDEHGEVVAFLAERVDEIAILLEPAAAHPDARDELWEEARALHLA